ncbi:hypothetical protein O3M35_002138 [Rhynocoris fuscipes]|uniref:Uncharacterized protein n=1 Tax=Rhynocoris fuscipes TaxID=488301 RepID=A0AAW1CWJ9_9HEMI
MNSVGLILVCIFSALIVHMSNAVEYEIPANRLNSQLYYRIHDREERDGGHQKFPTQNDGGHQKFPTQNDGGHQKFPTQNDGGHQKFRKSIVDDIQGVFTQNSPVNLPMKNPIDIGNFESNSQILNSIIPQKGDN